MTSASKKKLAVTAFLVISALVFLAFRNPFVSSQSQPNSGGASLGQADAVSGESELAAPPAAPPAAQPLKQLSPSGLNALLEEGLSPDQQAEIVGQFLLDYWFTHRSLPTGTFEEMKASLSGGNPKQMTHMPSNHPALAELGFSAKGDPSEIIIHVRSSREGAFDLIHTGPDQLAFTDDDLIRSFPAE